MKSYLNLGCGNQFHPAWTNVEFRPSDPSVLCWDLGLGVPFPDETFEVVYHSHLLEHFPRAHASPFLRECHRVMKPKGIIRVVVPDLERIVRIYLKALEGSLCGVKQWQDNYDWIMLELYDQTVREHAGGDMAVYLRQGRLANREFVIERLGVEAKRILREDVEPGGDGETVCAGRPSLPIDLAHAMKRAFKTCGVLREWVIKGLLGRQYELLQVGRFRRCGEVHLWMYDRYSLAELLERVGFENLQLVGPAESRIPNWADYHLDIGRDGVIYKPDSLYMEAMKP
jgi:predicted SAM-dependent methyltransferase